jgi:hypothetical protein
MSSIRSSNSAKDLCPAGSGRTRSSNRETMQSVSADWRRLTPDERGR